MHTSPPEPKGWVSLVGSLVQAEAPEKVHRAVQARPLSAPALSCCDARPGRSIPSQNAAPYGGSQPGELLKFQKVSLAFLS